MTRIEASPLPLRLARPFRIAHGVSTERINLLVRIGPGTGEAGLPPYLGIDVQAASEWIRSVELPDAPVNRPPPVESWLAELPEGPPAAVAAIDLALHDWWAQEIGQPLYVLLGLDPSRSQPSYQTLAIPESPDTLSEADLPHGSRIKLKLGLGHVAADLALVRRIRELTDATLCVDANGAWSIPDAVRAIPQLKELGVAFVEQPIAGRDPEDWHLLRRLLTGGGLPPLIADESVRTEDDVVALAGAADGINVKLAKCGGIARSKRLIGLARALDMQVVLGCMVESSLAITAAAHLASLADHVDLDGATLLADDPFVGAVLQDGMPVLPDGPGLGVRPRP